MNTTQRLLRRYSTALLALAILVWCAVDGWQRIPTQMDAAANLPQPSLEQGLMFAPLAVPYLLLLAGKAAGARD